jgi:hypothetical protein
MDLAAAKYRQLAIEAGFAEGQVDTYVASLREAYSQNAAAADAAATTVKSQSWEAFSTYLNSAVGVAVNSGNDAQEKYALGLIAQSEQAQHALIEGGIKITGGMEEFMKMIEDKSPELARKLKDLRDPIKAEGGIKPHGAYNDFRNSTFNLKQDFKDQDPNRIALIMRRDILKAAQSRGQSKVASPFGL